MADYQNIISTLQQIAGVSGVAVVDANGANLQSAMPADATTDLGQGARSVYGNIAVQIKRMQRGNLQRLVLETELGVTLLSGLAGGELLIVFVDVSEGFNLAQLIETASRF